MIDISCEYNDEQLRREYVAHWRNEVYTDIVGVPSVVIMVQPQTKSVDMVKQCSGITLVILAFLLGSLVIAYIFLAIRMARRNMFLCAALIKQMEATQQAERRSANKILAFASASHDIRSSLAAIDGIITICITEVAPNSEVHMNLEQMRTFTADLLGLLNSVLDTSKIEAGKVQLMEKEFYLGQALEECVNFYYPVGKEKGIDLVLDPWDGSVDKHPIVKGDPGKLKQVLNNLLHNAIKFTSHGHIVVRAWVNKPSPQNSILASKNNILWKLISQIICKNNETYNDLVSLSNQHKVEFVIEVDDTGKGIPKEKQKSIFEDFVQVKEDTLEGGTGLGLGIVQSLVRLMGGDIGIIDKDRGEKGTCFRFSILLSTCDTTSITSSDETYQMAQPDTRSHSPRTERSHILLFIQKGERRRVVQKFLQSTRVRVSNIDRKEDLFSTLERIKHTSQFPHHSVSEISDLESLSDSLATPNSLTFTLVIVDFSVTQFSDDQFSKLAGDSRFKVVWLYTPKADIEARRKEEKKLAKCDFVMSKPLHGSRLYQLIKLLPEFGRASTIERYRPSFTEEITPTIVKSQHHHEREYKLLEGKVVLVVEDTQMLRKLAVRLLEKHGASVECCENGEEAVERVCNSLRSRAGKLPYDFIFMDCQMPIMDGYEATRRIRLEEKLYRIRLPIIALTANAETDEQDKTNWAGMDAVITKPLNDKKLFEVIRSY